MHQLVPIKVELVQIQYFLLLHLLVVEVVEDTVTEQLVLN